LGERYLIDESVDIFSFVHSFHRGVVNVLDSIPILREVGENVLSAHQWVAVARHENFGFERDRLVQGLDVFKRWTKRAAAKRRCVRE
jgi:hypothetical protein